MMLSIPRVTIAIPIHGMKNGVFFLERCLDSILKQSFTDFDVVITDNSDDETLRKVTEKYGMKINYFKNPRKGMAQNTNEAIKRSTGSLIKILYMDDYFSHKHALQQIVEAFKGRWLINGTDNNEFPYWTDDIETGNNKLGSPSALTIKNAQPLLFDEKMTWLLDCDLYKRMYKLDGEPTILDGKHVSIGVGTHQISHLLTDKDKQDEELYMEKKWKK